jgi:hypothetical protein
LPYLNYTGFFTFFYLFLLFLVFFSFGVSRGVFTSYIAYSSGSGVLVFSSVILPGAGGLLQAIAGGVYLVAAFTLSRCCLVAGSLRGG